MSVNERMTAIADAIREKTGDTELLGLDQMAEKITDVYDAGKDNMIHEVWEAIQCGGKRTIYTGVLQNTAWTYDTFKPVYTIKPNSAYMFTDNCPPVATHIGSIKKQVDCIAQNINFDFSACTAADRACVGALFSTYNVLDFSNVTNLIQTFYGGTLTNNRHLMPTRIERLILSEKNTFQNTAFQFAYGYTYIGFEGVIANSINLSWSPLVPESMKKAILCLKNYKGTDSEFVKKISFSDACWAALEADSTAPDGNTWADYVFNLGWNT